LLARSPRDITVADVIECCQGKFTPVDCLSDTGSADCSFGGECVFLSLWEEVREAVNRVYGATTLQDLVEREQARVAQAALNYSI
jgi:DNA-binding IscR family transcriptional regulator